MSEHRTRDIDHASGGRLERDVERVLVVLGQNPDGIPDDGRMR